MNTHDLKVIMIISSFYPLIGGTEQQCQRLSQKLIGRGIDVCVVTRRYPGLKPFEVIDGIPVHRIRTIGSGSGAMSSLSFTFFCLLWMLREKLSGHWRDEKIIFHAHQALSPARIAVLAKLLFGGKAISRVAGGTEIGEIPHIQQNRLISVYRWFLSKIDRFIVLNQRVFEELHKMGIDRKRLMKFFNGVDTENFYSPSSEEKQALKQKLSITYSLVITFVGRLDPTKNLPLLLRAYATLRQTVGSSDFILVLIGVGSEQEALQALALELSIAEKILFLGRKENVHEYLKISDIFVLPSIAEGMSNALLEAMACGLAVIATDVGAATEVLRQGQVGLLIRSGDEAGLTEALKKLINDKPLRTRLGEQARAVILESHSLDRVVEQYLKLYAEL